MADQEGFTRWLYALSRSKTKRNAQPFCEDDISCESDAATTATAVAWEVVASVHDALHRSSPSQAFVMIKQRLLSRIK